MRIVSPGMAVRDGATPRAVRLGPLTGRLVSLGWLLSLAGALALGETPSASARVVAFAGVLWGIAWGRLDWSRRARWSCESLAVVAGLHAVAAMIALDLSGRVSWTFFAIVAALMPRLLPRPREAAAYVGGLALAPVAVAALAPARAPEGRLDALVAAFAVVAIAWLVARRTGFSASVRAPSRAEAPGDARAQPLGDVHRLHAKLAERVAADPKRFALLAMDVGLTPGAEPREVAHELALQLGSEDFVAAYDDGAVSVLAAGADEDAARMLARRLERAVAEMHRGPVAIVEPPVGIAVYPDDGRTAGELLERLDEHLRVAREARRPLQHTLV